MSSATERIAVNHEAETIPEAFGLEKSLDSSNVLAGMITKIVIGEAGLDSEFSLEEKLAILALSVQNLQTDDFIATVFDYTTGSQILEWALLNVSTEGIRHLLIRLTTPIAEKLLEDVKDLAEKD